MSVQSIRFCNVCDNKYYHHIEENSLVYFCRVCGDVDNSLLDQHSCVLNIKYDNKGSIPLAHIINKYTKYDPTLPHIYVPCPNVKCKGLTTSDSIGSTTSSSEKDKTDVVTDAIYIRYDEKHMKHLYICTICDHVWKTTDT